MKEWSEQAKNCMNSLEPDEREELELSLVLEPDYDVVQCDCGHDELAENVCCAGVTTACLNCYENAKAAFESVQQEKGSAK